LAGVGKLNARRFAETTQDLSSLKLTLRCIKKTPNHQIALISSRGRGGGGSPYLCMKPYLCIIVCTIIGYSYKERIQQQQQQQQQKTPPPPQQQQLCMWQTSVVI
jgi:hypothetical protein